MEEGPSAIGELDGEVLRAARSGCAGDPGAIAWVEGPLRRHMERGQLMARLPEALSWAVTGEDGRNGIYRWDYLALAPLLAATVASRKWPPRRTMAASVDAVVGWADLEARRKANADRIRDRDVDVARASTARVTWTARGPGNVRAGFSLGRLSFRVDFSQVADGRWIRSWMPEEATARHLADRRRGTGLFPAIDATLREVTREFLDRYQPRELEVQGMDAARNTHNARTYGTISPQDYGLRLDMVDGCHRADLDGVTGVRFVRLPEAVPSDPRPLPAGVTFGDGHEPLPPRDAELSTYEAPEIPFP